MHFYGVKQGKVSIQDVPVNLHNYGVSHCVASDWDKPVWTWSTTRLSGERQSMWCKMETIHTASPDTHAHTHNQCRRHRYSGERNISACEVLKVAAALMHISVLSALGVRRRHCAVHLKCEENDFGCLLQVVLDSL